MGSAIPSGLVRLFHRELAIAALVMAFSCGGCLGWVAHG